MIFTSFKEWQMRAINMIDDYQVVDCPDCSDDAWCCYCDDYFGDCGCGATYCYSCQYVGFIHYCELSKEEKFDYLDRNKYKQAILSDAVALTSFTRCYQYFQLLAEKGILIASNIDNRRIYISY